MTYNPDRWYKVYSDDRRNFTVVEKTEIDDDYLQNYLLNNNGDAYSENFGYRNDDFTFYVISGRSDAFALDGNGYVTSAGNDAYNVSEESYTVRALTPNPEGQDFYPDRSITTQDTIPIPESDYYYYHSDGELLSTLAGLTFDIDLGEDTSGWNYDTLDLDRSFIRVRSISGGSYSKDYKLSRQRYHSLTLPEDDYPTGSYAVSLLLYNNAGNYFSAVYDGSIYVDARTAPDVENFGINYLELKSTYFSDYSYVTGINEVKAYPNGDVIYMPTSNSTDVKYIMNGNDSHNLYAYGSVRRGLSESSRIYYNTNLLVWNVTAGQTEELSSVYLFDGQRMDIQLFDEDGAKEFVQNIDTENPPSVPNLCMIKNTVNVIAVRAALSNGEKSEIKYYSVYPSWFEMPENTSTQTNDDGGRLISDDNELIYTPDEDQSMEGVRIYASGAKELLPQSDGTYRRDADSGSSTYYFYAINSYGSIYYFGDTIRTMRDNEAPIITYTGSEQSDGEYRIKLKIEDLSLEYYQYDNPIELKLTFDEAYSERLGYTDGQLASFDLTIDEFSEYPNNITSDNDKEFVWQSEDTSSTGIYRVEVVKPKENFNSYMEVTVIGAVKYLPEEADNAPVSFSLTAEATDKFGYTGSASFDISAVNAKPHVVSDGSVKPEYQLIDQVGNYALMLPFNVPVRPEKSWIMPNPAGYQKEWRDAFPVTKDGTTEISFYDIFGTLYTQEITLEDVFGDYGVDLTISPEAYTTEAITVTARMADEDTKKRLCSIGFLATDRYRQFRMPTGNLFPPSQER